MLYLYDTIHLANHPAYYPAYPTESDGVTVNSWREHLCHIVAHELVHIVKVVFCPGAPAAMYSPNLASFHSLCQRLPAIDFMRLNYWVYGHTTWQDGVDTQATRSSTPLRDTKFDEMAVLGD